MAKTTTIPIEAAVRDRLRSYGTAGMTYSEVIQSVLDRIEREEFVRELRRQWDDPQQTWHRDQDIDWG